MESFVVQTDSYELDHGAFAHRSAASAAHSNTAAPPVSVLRKSRTGAARFRAHAVRPVADATWGGRDRPDPPLPAGSASPCALIGVAQPTAMKSGAPTRVRG